MKMRENMVLLAALAASLAFAPALSIRARAQTLNNDQSYNFSNIAYPTAGPPPGTMAGTMGVQKGQLQPPRPDVVYNGPKDAQSAPVPTNQSENPSPPSLDELENIPKENKAAPNGLPFDVRKNAAREAAISY